MTFLVVHAVSGNCTEDISAEALGQSPVNFLKYLLTFLFILLFSHVCLKMSLPGRLGVGCTVSAGVFHLY